MFEVEVQVGAKTFRNIEAAFTSLSSSMQDALTWSAKPLSGAMRDTLQKLHRTMAAKHSSGWSGGVTSGKSTLQRRSGASLAAMAQSIRVSGSGSIDTVAGQISSGFWAIHETGGTVRPTRSKYLTIPLPGALNSDGTPIRATARAWENTFVARSKRGNLLIFQKRGGRGIVPLYLLKESVTIPARLGMADTIDQDSVPYFERRAFDIIERAITRSMA